MTWGSGLSEIFWVDDPPAERYVEAEKLLKRGYADTVATSGEEAPQRMVREGTQLREGWLLPRGVMLAELSSCCPGHFDRGWRPCQ